MLEKHLACGAVERAAGAWAHIRNCWVGGEGNWRGTLGNRRRGMGWSMVRPEGVDAGNLACWLGLGKEPDVRAERPCRSLLGPCVVFQQTRT